MDKIKGILFNIMLELRKINNHKIQIEFSKISPYLKKNNNIIININDLKPELNGFMFIENFDWKNTKNIKFKITVNAKINQHQIAYYLTYMIGTALQIRNAQAIENDHFKTEIDEKLIDINTNNDVKAIIFNNIDDFEISTWFADGLLVPAWLFAELDLYYKRQNQKTDLTTLAQYFNVPNSCIIRRYQEIKKQYHLSNIINNLIF